MRPAAIAKGTGIIVTAGFAEIAAGSIAMGLGGYLAAKTDSEHYASELEREYRETVELPDIEIEEVAKVFRDYGLTEAQMAPVVSAITGNQKRWVDFMMRFELGLEEPDPARAGRSAATIAVSYIVGGLIPLAPYIVMKAGSSCALGFRGRHASRALRLRFHQGPLHRREALARRSANRTGRRPRSRGRIPHRSFDQSVIATQARPSRSNAPWDAGRPNFFRREPILFEGYNRGWVGLRL